MSSESKEIQITNLCLGTEKTLNAGTTELHGYLLKLGVLHACTTCTSFEKTEGFCVFWSSEPPLDVVVVGCEEWKSDEKIPF